MSEHFDPHADLNTLIARWHARADEEWGSDPERYRQLAAAFLKEGEPLLAYDVANEALETWGNDVVLRRLKAYALNKSGAMLQAGEILQQLRDEGHGDEETIGMLASSYKQLALSTREPQERAVLLRRAHDVYIDAYRRIGGYWTGINAATTALLLGEQELAGRLAAEVASNCRRLLDDTMGDDRYWVLATIGEAELIGGNKEEAIEWYRHAAAAAPGRFAYFASTRRNARLILEATREDVGMIDRLFPIPTVAAFVGHMVDRPGRENSRFPSELEEAVRQAIDSKIAEHSVGISYSSAAAGSDILMIESMLRLGGDVRVVLPYNREQFIEDSVDIHHDGQWRDRFDKALDASNEIVMCSQHRQHGDMTSFEYANLMIHGLARMRAEQLDTRLVPIVVWDGRPGDGPGGTASAVKHWRALGYEVEVIDLEELRREHTSRGLEDIVNEPRSIEIALPIGGEIPVADGASTFVSVVEGGGSSSRIMAMLFADSVHFSRLREDQIPLFLNHFLGGIGTLIDRSPHRPVLRNTWGDCVFLVYEDVRKAALFALELADLMNNTDWPSLGLPADANLRIALHVGPVYECLDPVTKLRNYLGSHVSRAARLEPITPPGHCFASQAFAALISAYHVDEIRCDYVGQTPLAKGYGTFATYHIYSLERPSDPRVRLDGKGGHEIMPPPLQPSY